MGVLCHVSTRQLVDTCRPQREKCCVMYSSSILVSLLLLAKQLQFPHGVSIVPSHIASQKISFDLEPDGLYGFIRKPFSQSIQAEPKSIPPGRKISFDLKPMVCMDLFVNLSIKLSRLYSTTIHPSLLGKLKTMYH